MVIPTILILAEASANVEAYSQYQNWQPYIFGAGMSIFTGVGGYLQRSPALAGTNANWVNVWTGVPPMINVGSYTDFLGRTRWSFIGSRLSAHKAGID